MKTNGTSALAEEIATMVLERMSTDGPLKPRLLTMEEATNYLGMSADAIRHKIAARQIPVTKIDKYNRFDVHALDKWIRENTRLEA